jgi:hypothetical protein
LNLKKRPVGDYSIGWGRPPVEFQYRKGHSGNYSGRPHATVESLGEQLEKATSERLPVTENGVRKMLTQRQISAAWLANKMAAGDMAAWKKFVRIFKRDRRNAVSEPGMKIVVVPDDDPRVAARR